MDNESDDPESIIAALHRNFELVDAEIVGSALIWKAQRPKAGPK